jgi:hypothetical protein
MAVDELYTQYGGHCMARSCTRVAAMKPVYSADGVSGRFTPMYNVCGHVQRLNTQPLTPPTCRMAANISATVLSGVIVLAVS